VSPSNRKDASFCPARLLLLRRSIGSLVYELLVGFTPFPGGPPIAPGSAEALVFPSSCGMQARWLAPVADPAA
jgi:hypothetical protein